MVTIKIVLDNRRKKADEVYSIKIRVTWNREQRYYLTGFKMDAKEFDQLMKTVPPKRLQNIKIELEEMILKARLVVKDLQIFSFTAFEQKFLKPKPPKTTLTSLYNEVIQEKRKSGAIGTAVNYECSIRSLKTYCEKIDFADITPTFLHHYEKHLLAAGKQVTTVGIYMRPLRAIINLAISNEIIPRELYPFGRKKYVIPEGRNPKKALDDSDFKKIWSYKCVEEYSFEDRSKDFFILSYLCQGVNFKDLLLLKKKQLTENEIQFVRQKTKETSRSNPILVTVPLLDVAKKIINKWKSNDKDSAYVFGFIKPGMSEADIYKTNMQFVKITNKYMSSIATELGITKRITTYVARHQFSKAIIDSGESIEYLSECLGHSSISVTKSYVQRFSLAKRISTAQKLIPEI